MGIVDGTKVWIDGSGKVARSQASTDNAGLGEYVLGNHEFCRRMAAVYAKAVRLFEEERRRKPVVVHGLTISRCPDREGVVYVRGPEDAPRMEGRVHVYGEWRSVVYMAEKALGRVNGRFELFPSMDIFLTADQWREVIAAAEWILKD